MLAVMGTVVRESVRHLPDSRLRSAAAWYSGYRQAGMAPATQRGLPSPWLTFIVALDDPLVIARHPDPHQAPGRYQSLVGGLHTVPAHIVHDGRQSGIQIALHPLAAGALFGLPAGELAGRCAAADAVLGAAADLLREQVLAAGCWDQRMSAVDRWLLGRMEQGDRARPPPGVTRAWEVLIRSGGTVPVEALVREVAWSERRLRDQMLAWTGLSPKSAARVIRFDRARRQLAAAVAGGHPGGLADLAVRCGYYDQAHLAREFNRLAGCAPSRWAAEEFRNIQAGAHAEPSESTP